jgi:hypothetical protein
MFFAAMLAVGAPRASAQDRNKCGCYQEGSSCYCDKGAKCGCPGECEPKGCEEQRNRELQREIEKETKKAESGQKQPEPGAGDEGRGSERRAPARPAKRRLSPAEGRQLAKLIDLFLADHPEARGESIEQVRNDLTR